ncbi:tropomyosin-1, isoforms 33/34-like [Tigriopus californicus]|uniref:tropomyosin-1, isoforms 33/34-like n=1 Tax=Tigriopus californicus TaxID=6832 RepID=UPI0027DA7B9B|nr:tropomyosin-1, isoforms 33/34-like [Tigriopus californicus]
MSDPAPPAEAPPAPEPEVAAPAAPPAAEPATAEHSAATPGAKAAPKETKKGKGKKGQKAEEQTEAEPPKKEEEVEMVLSHKLDTDEWDLTLGKMLRYHFNIGEELRILIQQIRKEMKEELVPLAEDRATYGKIVKQRIREMWGLEYEILEIQEKFLDSMGSIDLNNLTDDFVEEVMLQSKPLQGTLMAIRKRQVALMTDIQKEYNDHIKDLEPMKLERPPKPEPKPEPPKEEAPKEASETASTEAKPQTEGAPETPNPPPEATTPSSDSPNEPSPAIDASAAPAAVEASA